MIIRRHITSNFTVIPNEVIMDTRLSIGSRWLLTYLLSRPQDWTVQIADIQKQAAIGRDKAYALVKELITIGWVRRDDGRQVDGKWSGVEYVVMDQPEAASDTSAPLPENPDTANPLPVNPHLTKDGKKPRTETTKSLSSDDEALAEDFAEFWAAYPKRPNNSRKAAMKAFISARRRLLVSQKHLLTKVREYAAYVDGEDPKFTAMASTWLNGERWNNDFTKDARVIKSYKDIARGDPAAVELPMDRVTKLVAAYPGIPTNLNIIIETLVQCRAVDDLPEIIEAAEKYALLVKQQRADGLSVAPPALEYFIRFKWRDMNRYEFYHPGMAGKKAVRPKRERTSA